MPPDVVQGLRIEHSNSMSVDSHMEYNYYFRVVSAIYTFHVHVIVVSV